MGNIKCIELTKDNYEFYLDKVEELEQLVSERMTLEGRIGQFFTTGKEGIEEYILSENNTVMIAVNDSGKIQSATYITQGQAPFTYNDITKYFKYGEKYNKYVRSTYSSELEYKRDILKIYEIKLKAYEYAKNKVLRECPEYNGNIMKYLQDELQDKDNEFHEKSDLREGLNKYMSEYIEDLAQYDDSIKHLYEMFYWISARDISEIFGRNIKLNNTNIREYEILIESQKSQEYTQILSKGDLKVLEEPKFDISKYFNANTDNSIEIDTYITNPNSRQSGLARIIVYEGLKKHIKRYFENSKNNEIYLCSTLHRDNISSKYVSEFFGLNNSLYVQRRHGRNREVHICRITRDEYERYLESMEDKLITLYDYNPNNKSVSDNKKLEILEEQLKYEAKQIESLRVKSKGHYKGNFDGITRKTQKIEELELKAREVRSRIDRRIKNMMCSR